MIQFKKVTKIYESVDKKVKAVDRINLFVEKGQICVFLGPSGCGKTTLLRLVNRLISITEGMIEVDGQDINHLDTIQLRRSIGYVIQQNGLFPNMTIEENIAVVPKLLKWQKARIDKRYQELMDMMGLPAADFRKRFPWELSGGQQQRIGVARALAADPPVMLMDEPFGALDPVIREHIQNEFLRIQKDLKKTILFVSHDIDEALKLGDTIAIFKEGQLMQHDSPYQILSEPKNEFVHEFVGHDRALKRLSLLTVRDLVEQKEGLNGKHSLGKDVNDRVVQIDMNLRTALSVILSSSTGEASVVDENDQLISILNVADFATLTGVHPHHLDTATS